MITKFFKRRLASCLCFVLAVTCIISSLPPGLKGGSYQVSAASDGYERNWALGASYEMEYANHHDYDDPNGTKLTDGVYASDYTNDLLVFATRFGTSYITIDLGHEREVNQIIISGFERDSYGITAATDVTVEFYNEATGEWETATSWQNSSHFTGNDDDGLGVGYGIYEEKADVNFTTSQVRIGASMDNGWMAYNEIEIWGPVDENIPSIPVLEQDLLPQIVAPFGEDLTLSVALEPMEYGEGDITYEWYKNGQKVEGADTDTLTIPAAGPDDAGSYYVVVTNTIGELSETVTSSTCEVSFQDVSTASLLYGIPFTTSMTYGDPNNASSGNYIERDPSKPAEYALTDGLKANGDINSILAARYNKNKNSLTYADFTFDMGEVKQFAQINIGTLGGGISGIYGPSRFQIYVTTDEGDNAEWDLIHDVELGEDAGIYEYVYRTNGAKVSARQIRFFVYFDPEARHNWISLDEIELLAEADGREPDGIFTTGGYVPPEQENIASWQKSYTVNQTSEDDPDLTALTDGMIGDSLGNNWVKYPASSDNLEVVIDLDEPTAFEQVNANFLFDEEKGIQWPERVRAEYSNDGSSWNLIDQTDLDLPTDADSEIAYVQLPISDTITARYVKLTVQGNGIIALDDVMVLKQKTVIEAPEDPDVVVDPNNLAYGKTYTTSWPANSSYPDDNYELTNGKRGRAAYNDSEWVGYHMNDGASLGINDFYVTLDLGSAQSFEQVKVGTLEQQSSGIHAATAMGVEYSNDMQDWTPLSDDTLNFAGDGVHRYIATADSAVSARYVRVKVVGTGWFFLDEIEVLQTKDPNPDANENPDYGVELNLLRDNSNYSVSQKPDINNLTGLLTDGKYGVTYTKYDTNWMGFNKAGHVVMNFDLRASASVSQIIVSSREDSANQQTLPDNLTVYGSNNNVEWVELTAFDNPQVADGQNYSFVWDASESTFPNPLGDAAEYAYIRYIRVEFDVPSGGDYVYLDEVKAMGKLGECCTAGTPYVTDETGARNLAIGTSYTYYPEDVEGSFVNSYADDAMTRLTDGINGGTAFNDGTWVGFNRADFADSDDLGRTMKKMRSIIVDLENLKTIKSITFGNVVSAGAGISAAPNFNIYVSVDGEKWLQLSRSTSVGKTIPDGRYTYGWRNENVSPDGATFIDLVPDYEMVIARYVRLEIEVPTWTFIDEITVQGYDEQIEGAHLANDGTADIDGEYQKAGEDTGNVQDMVLWYTGWYGYDSEGEEYIGEVTLNRARPLLTYIDKNNQAVDTMFDSVLLLALKSQYGRYFSSPDNGYANATDWFWFMDKTFEQGGDMDTLNEAARRASEELGDPDYKVKVVLMYPTTYDNVTTFGSLDGERNLTFETEDDHIYALNWWLDEALKRFDEGDYDYIDFVGFYYLDEGVNGVKAEERVMRFTDTVHEKGLKAFWIPYWNAPGLSNAHNYGFDATALQPNHFFDYTAANSPYLPGSMTEPVKNGNPLMETHAYQIKTLNLGPEFEVEGDVFTEPIKYNIWLDYLNAAEQYGYDGPGNYRAWYLDRTFSRAAYSGNDIIRTIYDYTYQVMKGTYTQKDYIDPADFPTDPDDGGLWYNEDSSIGGGGSGSGSSGGGGGYYPTDPEEPSGDENYTWEETDEGYQLTDKDGEIITGWAKVDGKWYYLNDNGIRQTGWQKVDNKWYYLKADGVMATGWLKLGNVWYFLNAGGIMQTGWLYNGGAWYYLYDWGGMANSGWVQVGNTWYYFRGNGAMATGWLQQGSTWYYLKDSGAMATGWNWVGSKCYYFYGSGKMAANTTVGGYKLDASGAWVQ